MIPQNRPFLGQDLDDFRQRFALTTDDMCFFCGVTRNRWFMMVSKEKDLPLRDVPIALICRLIDGDDSLNYMPNFTAPQDLLEKILKSDRKINKREFSVMMGNNGTSANRWTRGRKRATPPVFRLATVVDKMIEKYGIDKAMLKARDVVTIESNNRGIRDVFVGGTWAMDNEEIDAKRVKLKKYGKQKEAEADASE